MQEIRLGEEKMNVNELKAKSKIDLDNFKEIMKLRQGFFDHRQKQKVEIVEHVAETQRDTCNHKFDLGCKMIDKKDSYAKVRHSEKLEIMNIKERMVDKVSESRFNNK